MLIVEPADHAGLPADAGADEQGPAVGLALHDLGEVGAERPADEAAGLVQDRVEVVGAEGELAELRERGLLGQQLLVAGSSPARHDAETRGRAGEFLARASWLTRTSGVRGLRGAWPKDGTVATRRGREEPSGDATVVVACLPNSDG